MRKRVTLRTSMDMAIVNIWQREISELSTRKFTHRFAVSEFDLRSGAATQLFTCESIPHKSYSIDLNAIAIDPRNPNLIAVVGLDEYTRLYGMHKYKWDDSTDFGQPTDFFCPPHLIRHEHGAITGMALFDVSELLVSYSDEFIYLFTREMGFGPNPRPASPLGTSSDACEIGPDHQSASSPSDMDADLKVGPQVYKGHKNCETVKGEHFFGPKCEYVVSGSDCGRIFIWKKKDDEFIHVMEADEHVVNCIESHPRTTVLASSGIEDNIKLWTPKTLDRESLPINFEKDNVLRPNQLGFFPIADTDEDDYDNYECEYDYDDGDYDEGDNGTTDDSDAGDGFGDDSDCFSCGGNDDPNEDDDDDNYDDGDYDDAEDDGEDDDDEYDDGDYDYECEYDYDYDNYECEYDYDYDYDNYDYDDGDYDDYGDYDDAEGDNGTSDDDWDAGDVFGDHSDCFWRLLRGSF